MIYFCLPSLSASWDLSTGVHGPCPTGKPWKAPSGHSLAHSWSDPTCWCLRDPEAFVAYLGPWSFQVSKCFLFWRFRFVFVESDRDLKPAIQVGAGHKSWTEPFLVPLFLSSKWAMHWRVLYWCSEQGDHLLKQDSSLAQSSQAYLKMEKAFDRTAAWQFFNIFLDFDTLYSSASSIYLYSLFKNVSLADAPHWSLGTSSPFRSPSSGTLTCFGHIPVTGQANPGNCSPLSHSASWGHTWCY